MSFLRPSISQDEIEDRLAAEEDDIQMQDIQHRSNGVGYPEDYAKAVTTDGVRYGYNEDDGEESRMLLQNDTSMESHKTPRGPRDGGSLLESCLLMANSIIGAGIIGLPFSFREAGIWMGIILLVVLTVVVDWTIRLLVSTSKMSGRSSYQDLMHFCFGRSGLIAISVFQFAFAFGGMCAFCVIIVLRMCLSLSYLRTGNL